MNDIKTGWLVNDTLTCIPGTKTFWHDLLEWIPNLKDKTSGYTDFGSLPNKIELDASRGGNPDYIIRNATFFRKMNISTKTISLLQDKYEGGMKESQITVCNNSDITVFNSPYTYNHYKNVITSKMEIIPLGIDSDFFLPLPNKKEEFRVELGILPNSILFIGAANNHPKGFDKLINIINNTSYNFVLVMKDGFSMNHERVRCFNSVDHNILLKIFNACSMMICTSVEETQHLAGLEGGLCGLPIVTSNVGIYFNRTASEWGLNTDNEYISGINHIMTSLDKYNPREYWLNEKITKHDCSTKWRQIINDLFT